MTTSVTSRFLFGSATVATAGVAVQVEATEYQVVSVLLIAKKGNSSKIFYGGSDVDSSTQAGLDPSESVAFSCVGSQPPFSLTEIYVDAAVNGEGVDYVAVKG